MKIALFMPICKILGNQPARNGQNLPRDKGGSGGAKEQNGIENPSFVNVIL